MDNGWVKLHRKLLNWEWYDDINTKVVFLHLLLTVNHEDGRWHGKVIKRGQRVSSLSKLAKECRLTVQELRTSLGHLKSTQEITSEGHGSFTLLTVCKYDDYQQINRGINKVSTSDQQLYKNVRIKEDKNKDKEESRPEFENFCKFCQSRSVEVRLLERKFFEIREEHGPLVNWWVEAKKCVDWISDNGKKKVTAQRLRNWMINARRFQKEREIKTQQEFQDKKNQLAPKIVKPKFQPVWQAPA